MPKLKLNPGDLSVEVASHSIVDGLTRYNINVKLFNNLIIESNIDEEDDAIQPFIDVRANKTIEKKTFWAGNKGYKDLEPNEAYVHNIVLPETLRGQGLAEHIYQEIANVLNIRIIPGCLLSDASEFFWKKRKKFWKKILLHFIPKITVFNLLIYCHKNMIISIMLHGSQVR